MFDIGKQFLLIIILQTATMTNNKDLSIDNIIKKYQNRQDKLTQQITLDKLDHKGISSQKQDYPLQMKSGLSTPEFSNTITKRQNSRNGRENVFQKTHKKQDNYSTFNPQEITQISFTNAQQRGQFESLLKKLDQTEQKLVRSERNYAEMWRKYEKLMQDRQFTGKEVEIQQQLRQKEVIQLKSKMNVLERQTKNYRECLASKDSCIVLLKEKLKEKSEKFLQCERIIAEMKSEIANIRSSDQISKEEADYQQSQKHSKMLQLQEQISRLEKLLNDKENERKQLLKELQGNYISHKDELEVLKKGYLKVEEQYKDWIEQCSKEKLQLIQSYEQKLQEASKTLSNNNFQLITQEKFEEEMSKNSIELRRLISLSSKQSNQIKTMKSQLEKSEKAKLDLIIKVSSLQNAVISKNETFRMLQSTYSQLVQQYHAEEKRNRETTGKYNTINAQFLELKNKCGVLFGELEDGKRSKVNENSEIVRARKQIVNLRQQLQKSKNNQFTLNSKLTEMISSIKTKLMKVQYQKEQTMSDLLAQRLQNVKLKQEIRETKENLKRQYQLSLQNTKIQLQNQIHKLSNGGKNNASVSYDIEKQKLYLQLRQLERKYELLANQIVTVDEMMSIASKVQKRNQCNKK